ncbi:MAG: beta-galactosidase, partial [Ignisphaera sp.]
VENEYFWGNVKYLETLYAMAREYVKDIPIVTNEDWHVEGTDIVNTIDDYPVPWDTKNFDIKVKNYIKTQPGMIKMFMELEGGWFTYFGSLYPTSRGDLPAEWIEILLKTAIGLGINAINMYMFYGGTNPGYYTGKYITSSYDFEAPIREWGELSKKYYAVKRVALFIRSFNDLLTHTKPIENVVELSNKTLDVFARVNNNGTVIAVIRNLDLVPQPTTIKFKDAVYPINGVVRVPQRNAKIVLINYRIEGTPFKIAFSSAEPLIVKTVGNDTLMIFYGDIAEVGEVVVEVDEGADVAMLKDVAIVKQGDTRIILRYSISGTENIAILRSANHTLYLLIISRDRAERTWYIDDVSPPIIMVSNLYFVGQVLCEKDSYALKLELDENSCGDILLISFNPIARMILDERELKMDRIYGIIYSAYLDMCSPNVKPLIDLRRDWRIKEDILLADVPLDAKKPLEYIGFNENGYYVYEISFNLGEDIVSELENHIMLVSNFNDYATIILNNKILGSGYHSIEVDTSRTLKANSNKLLILVESTGHSNDGLMYIPNGVIGDIYIGKVYEEVIRDWSYIEIHTPYSKDFSMTEFLYDPENLLSMLNNVNTKSLSEKTGTLYKQGLYVAKLKIDNRGYRYVLDLGKATYLGNHFYYPRAIVFVNKKYVGVYRGPIDISEYLVEGLNEIAIYIDWTRMALQPLLKVYQYVVSGTWKVKQYTEGLEKKWYAEDIDDSSWSLVKIPTSVETRFGGLVWLRGTVNISIPRGIVTPLKIVLNIRGARALIYFNGQLIGRYVEEGPQFEFYIPQPLVKDGENSIALAVHTVNGKAYIDRISIEPYHIHLAHELKLHMT